MFRYSYALRAPGLVLDENDRGRRPQPQTQRWSHAQVYIPARGGTTAGRQARGDGRVPPVRAGQAATWRPRSGGTRGHAALAACVVVVVVPDRTGAALVASRSDVPVRVAVVRSQVRPGHVVAYPRWSAAASNRVSPRRGGFDGPAHRSASGI